MSDPFLAEIRIFPYGFAPRGWAFCDGQLMPVSQSTALFQLLGKTYGGDGVNTFGLPNLQGRAPMHPGQGPGLSPHVLAETGGVETVTLDSSQIPSHSHPAMAASTFASADTNVVANNSFGKSTNGNVYGAAATQSPAVLNLASLDLAGGDQPHNNMQPYLTLTFCIATAGVSPTRS